jgi:hypothetical protein
MLKLACRAAVTAALTDRQLDPELRAILGLRAWQLDDVRHQPLGETVQFVIVQPHDTAEEIHEAVRFSICWDQADQPGWEWMEDHGAWFELAYVLTDDLGLIVFVADHPDTNGTLLFNCRGVANRKEPA